MTTSGGTVAVATGAGMAAVGVALLKRTLPAITIDPAMASKRRTACGAAAFMVEQNGTAK